MSVGVLVPARRFDAEIMDRDDNSPDDLQGALRDIRFVNRMLGGRRAMLRAFDPFLDRAPAGRPLRVLDVGTGGGDLAVAMVDRTRARGRRIEVTALDRDPNTVSIARRETAGHPEIRVVRGDAFDLPFERGSFDLVTASLFLHHFDDRESARLLRSFRSVADRAVLINDLRRHVVPWSFIYLFARVTFRHPMFSHDAPLSVLRSFTGAELSALGAAAGAPAPRVSRCWPYRLVMTLPGSGAGS